MHFNGAVYKIPACQLPRGFSYGALRGVLFLTNKKGGLVHENNVNVIKYIYIYILQKNSIVSSTVNKCCIICYTL